MVALPDVFPDLTKNGGKLVVFCFMFSISEVSMLSMEFLTFAVGFLLLIRLANLPVES